MSSEVRQYIIEDASKKSEIFSAQPLKLPIKKKILKSKSTNRDKCAYWKLYDKTNIHEDGDQLKACLLYTSPSPRDTNPSRMPSSA